jgi:RHS repeat-associated protein
LSLATSVTFLGDRMRQTVNTAVTRYTLDLSGGLTQVLYDETKSYVYGLDLLSQQTTSTEEYLLRDGLGSIRQLTEQSSAITMFNSYEPYGEIFSSSGSGSSSYGFAGEWTDETGLMHLRARYYASAVGRFLVIGSQLQENIYSQQIGLIPAPASYLSAGSVAGSR